MNLTDLVAMTQVVSPGAANARRLLACYQQAYRNDEQLYRLITQPQSDDAGVDGLTEPMTVALFEHLLQLDDGLVLEVPDPAGAEQPPLGFVCVSYCTQEAESIRRFRRHFLGEVFDPQALEYTSDDDRDFLDSVLDQGNVAYFGEFVSIHDRTATLALRIASWQRICVERMGQEHCKILGKCLDKARIGNHVNEHGNLPVLQVADATGMRPVATAWQTRPLTVSRDVLLDEDDASSVTADLRFALYVGNTSELGTVIQQKLARI